MGMRRDRNVQKIDTPVRGATLYAAKGDLQNKLAYAADADAAACEAVVVRRAPSRMA
jgi:hypothetical protein